MRVDVGAAACSPRSPAALRVLVLRLHRLLADAGDFQALVREVVERHYDPSYARSSKRDTRPRLGMVTLASLTEVERDRAEERDRP